MSGKLIFKNASYLFISNVIVRIITASVTIYIARILGVQEYGLLSVSLAFAAVAGYFTDLGLTHTLMREATKKDASLPVLMSSFFRMRLFLAFLTCLICFIAFETFYPDLYFKTILYLVVLPTTLGAALQGVGAAYFQVIEKMHLTALIRTIAGLVTSFSLVLGIIFNWSLMLVALIYGLSNILAGIMSIIIVTRNIKILTGWDKSVLNGVLSFTISGFVIMLLPQLGPIILEKVSSLEEVGYFSVAYRIPAVLYQLPGIIAVAFYPILFRYGNNGDFEEHLKLNIIQLKIMSLLGILMSISFLLFSDWWTLLLFGEKWVKAATTLSILSMIVIVQAISFPIADALTTTGLQSRRMRVLIVGLFVSVPVYFFLGIKYGSIGGAIAAVITEVFLLVGFLLCYPKRFILILKGLSFNLGAFGITLIVYKAILINISPLIANILAILTLICSSLLLDKDLRYKSNVWIKKKFLKIRKHIF